MSTRVRRFDRFVLDRTATRRRDTDGCLVVQGRVARVGIQEYDDGFGGLRREYRPQDEVAAEESVTSFDGAAVTDLHPASGLVTPTTYRQLARGHVQGPRFDDGWLLADFFVADDELGRKVELGERVEVSAGYTAELDETPGTTPDGEAYDAVQRRIRGNHVALLPAGTARAGREARLILDAAGNQTEEGAQMEEEKKEPAKEESKAPPPPEEEEEVLDAAAVKALRDENASLKRSLDEARAMADALRGRVEQLEADAKAVAAKTDSLIEARLRLVERASKLAGRPVVARGSDRAIITEALAARGVKLDAAASDEYLRARFDATEELAAASGGRTVGALTSIQPGAAPAATDPITAALEARRASEATRRN